MHKKILFYIFVSIALILMYYLFSTLLQRLQRVRLNTYMDYQEIKIKSQRLFELQDLLLKNNIKLSIIERLKSQNPASAPRVDFLRRITLYTPSNLYLRKLRLNFEKKYILISGTCLRKNTLPSFIKKLREDPIVNYIKVKGLSRRIYKKDHKIGYDFDLFVKML